MNALERQLFTKLRNRRGITGRSVALLLASISSVSGFSATAQTRDAGNLEEVIVTAQKRSERLQDVPVPVTAINGDALVNGNQLQLATYYTKVPGLNLTILGDAGGPLLSIRGVTTGGFVNPTVATVIDDIPFGASTIAVNGNLTLAPDFDPSDLARVEVLRGPQGTLYGASSLGGLVKYVTVDPTTDRLNGTLRFGTTSVEKGEIGYSLRGSVNVPVSDTLAVRASAFGRRDPGYIDNLQTGQDDVNRLDSTGGRVSALWRPSDDLWVKLSALYQHAEQDGSPEVHLPSAAFGPPSLSASGRPDLGDLEQNSLIDTGWYDQESQAYSATVQATLGEAELTFLSGYSVATFDTSGDVTGFLGNQTLNGVPSRGFAGFGVSGAAQNLYPETTKFSQEARLRMPLGSRVDWLFGLFYTDEDYTNRTQILAMDATNGRVAGEWLRIDSDGSYEEYAAFTDLTFQITDRFDLQVGARQSHNKQTIGSTSNGVFNTVIAGLPSTRSDTPQTDAEDDSFTYLFTPRFKISPELMTYLRLASGYRPGGSNTNPTARAAGLPFEYGHDTTETYELGVKGNTGGGISFDASVYYIDWQDIQLQLRDPVINLTYTTNVAGARSQGVELAVDLRPVDGLTISAWGAYNDAELTDVPTTSTLVARPGDDLPYSARRSGNLSVEHEFPLWSNAVAFVAASASYVGERKGRFFTSGRQGVFPSYAQVDLRAGVELGSWSVDAFVNNVADKRGVLRNGRDSNLSRVYAVNYILPRTIGLSLTRSF